MNIAYGIPCGHDDVVVVGSVSYTKPNGVKIIFNYNVEQLGSAMHRLVLLAPASLVSFNQAQIPDLDGVRPETKLWANPEGKRPNHRPQTFKGWPFRENMIVLVPVVPDLTKFERTHTGFIEAYHAPKPKRRARSLDDL